MACLSWNMLFQGKQTGCCWTERTTTHRVEKNDGNQRRHRTEQDTVDSFDLLIKIKVVHLLRLTEKEVVTILGNGSLCITAGDISLQKQMSTCNK